MGSGRDAAHTEVLLAGAAAAFTVDLLVYPLDTIKSRYQSRQYLTHSGAKKSLSGSSFKGLYQGIGSVVIATLPAAGVFFLTYENAKSALSTAIPRPMVHALASGSAELASCVVLTPAEVIKQNAQVLQSGPRGRQSASLEALRMVWGSDGRVMRRLWSGYSALVARNLPFTALHFPMFEFFRGHLWERRHRRGRSLDERRRIGSRPISGDRLQAASGSIAVSLIEVGAVTGAAAALSGAIAAFVTTPTDVVKTRMMLLDGDAGVGGRQAQQGKAGNTGFRIAKNILRETGVHGLFRGAIFRIAWTALGSGLYLGSYEMAKSWLKADSPPTGNTEHTSA